MLWQKQEEEKAMKELFVGIFYAIVELRLLFIVLCIIGILHFFGVVDTNTVCWTIGVAIATSMLYIFKGEL